MASKSGSKLTHERQNASRVVAALEEVWRAIQARHVDVPDVVVAMGSGTIGQRGGAVKLGHFAAGRWQVPAGELPELFVGGEGFSRGPEDVLATLLHEAAHGVAHTRGIQDTSRGGRYHNRRFAATAAELGLVCEQAGSRGWSSTVLGSEAAGQYGPAIRTLAEALDLVRRGEPTGPKRPAKPQQVAAVCGCGRKIRVMQSTLDAGPITCGICEEAFSPAT